LSSKFICDFFILKFSLRKYFDKNLIADFDISDFLEPLSPVIINIWLKLFSFNFSIAVNKSLNNSVLCISLFLLMSFSL
jgi:hypothetical protein